MKNDRRNQEEVVSEWEHQNDLFGNPPPRWEQYKIARKRFRNGSPKEVFFEDPIGTKCIEEITENAPDAQRLFNPEGIGRTLKGLGGGQGAKNMLIAVSENEKPFIVAQRGRNPENPKSRKAGLPTEQMLEARLDGNTNTLTSVQKDNYVSVALRNKNRSKHQGKDGLKYGDFQKVYEYEANKDGVSFAVKSALKEFSVFNGRSIRQLTPIECERLMSWPDNHTKSGINEKGEKVEISDSQRYKMCGNGVVSSVVKAVVENLIL